QTFDSFTDDATLENNSGDLRVVDVTCTDCLNATEIEDIFLLNAGDTATGLMILPDLRAATLNSTSTLADTLNVNTTLNLTGGAFVTSSSTVTSGNWLTASSSSLTSGDFVKLIANRALFTGNVFNVLGDDDTVIFRVSSAGGLNFNSATSTDSMYIGGLAEFTGATASSTGLVIGGDTTIFRSAANSITLQAATTTASTVFLVGSETNGLIFNPTFGPLYSGNARPTRTVTLTPEYPGAVLTGTGSGTMTSDFCEQGVHADIPDTDTSSCESGQIHNFYNWTTTQGSDQTYSVWLRWKIPYDFSSWISADPIKVWARRSDGTNGSVRVYVYGTNGALENTSGTETAGTANIWTQTSVKSAFSAGTYATSSYMTIRVDMIADQNDNVKIGEIDLLYRSTN
ncbi:MAG: hypothetical protein Q8P75_02195, partial [bacterium]|nr:hypothetical protein [bacterium]